MNSIDWSFNQYATFRAALAFLLQRNEWAEKYYYIASLVDTMNTICGYKDADDDMKKNNETSRRGDDQSSSTGARRYEEG